MKILNIKNLTFGDANSILDFCTRTIEERRAAFLIPMNPIKVIKARKQHDFQRIIDSAHFVFPDAVGIKYAAWFLYKKRIDIIPGYQLMFSLLKQANFYKRRIFILGAKQLILEDAIECIRREYPEIAIAGYHNGFYPDSQEPSVFRKVISAEPDYIFVAMGEYKQELVISKLLQLYPRAVYLGVGGSVDLLASHQPYPPTWITNMHLEWFFRLIRQPFRLPRFKALPIFVFLIIVEKIKLKIS